MKQFTRAVVSAALCAALSLACTLPAYAEEGEMLEVNEDILVSADYDWTRFANDHLTLNVYNWGLYISDGSDDSVNVISAFEDLTGIKVNYTTFDSNESLYAKMKSGGASYDVIVPSDYMVGKMIAENMLAELDYDNIPNMANIGENYLGWSYDPDNTYSVPYTWGTTGIIYNTTMVEEPPTSWADLWDVEYAGNVLMFNNSRDAYAIAAKKMGLSLNPSSVEEVDDVMKELQAQKSVVQAYVMDEIFDKMEGGEAAMAPYYAGIIYNTTMVEEPPTSWADLWDVEYAGNVLMFNNSRDAYAIAAKKMGLSLNPSSVEEVDDVMKELQAQKSVVQAYVMDEIFDKMEGGEAAMAPYYAGDALTMIDENPDLAFVSPEEGVNFFVDSMCIPASSKHKEAAEMFINFMCEPDVGYQNCAFIGYSTPITEVWERLDDDLKYSPIAYPSDEVMNKAEVFVTLPDDINAEMDAKWSEMKSYDESGSGWLIVVFLLGAIAISGFNIWRKMRKKVQDNY